MCGPWTKNHQQTVTSPQQYKYRNWKEETISNCYNIQVDDQQIYSEYRLVRVDQILWDLTCDVSCRFTLTIRYTYSVTYKKTFKNWSFITIWEIVLWIFRAVFTVNLNKINAMNQTSLSEIYLTNSIQSSLVKTQFSRKRIFKSFKNIKHKMIRFNLLKKL